MDKLALKYINALRTEFNLTAFKLGTLAMLDNAIEHCVYMSKSHLQHQTLEHNICGTKLRGENVAQNHVYLSKPLNKPTDPVQICMDQFISSKPHKDNLLTTKASHLVMGTYIDEVGYIWCTQTFWRNVTYGTGDCARA